MKKADYGDGYVFQRGKRGTWYVRYCVNSKAFTERAVNECGRPVETEREAQIFLRRKLNEAGAGIFIPPQTRNLRVQSLFEALEAKYKQDGRQLIDLDARWRLHLEPFFGGRKVEEVTHDAIMVYRSKRLEEKAKPATINRELESLRRMFRLAKRAGKVRVLPEFPEKLREDNVRSGFLEEKEFRQIIAGTQELWLRALLFTFYHCGDRRGELIPTRRHPDRGLRVRQVELHNGLIRLTTKTKTGKARTLPITFDMKPLLTACVFGKGPEDHVFTFSDGKPVREDDLRSAWIQLTRKLGLGRFVIQTFGEGAKQKAWRRWKPSLLIHDFRRSAVRNLIQRGVSQGVAMSISGHETDSVFRRYQIVSESDIIEAGRKIALKPANVVEAQIHEDCHKIVTNPLFEPAANA
jgi:integrase